MIAASSPEQRQPGVPGQRRDRHRRGEGRANAERHRAMIALQVDRGIEHQQRHSDRKRHRDQGRRHLEDRRQFVPAGAEEFDRNETGDPGDEQHDDVGERQASALSARGKPAQDHAHEGMIAPPVGHRAADEGQDRQRQPRDFVGPQERALEVDPRGDIGQHQHEFAEQGGNDHAFCGKVDKPQRRDFTADGGAGAKRRATALPRSAGTISIALIGIDRRSSRRRTIHNAVHT